MSQMKLSEAIRLGAMVKQQATGITSSPRGTCALGAALEAVGRDTSQGWFPVYDIWPIACEYVVYPGDKHTADGLMLVGSCCWILNDADRWTREQIADWVETVETTLSTEPNGTLNGDAVPVRPTVEVPVCSR